MLLEKELIATAGIVLACSTFFAPAMTYAIPADAVILTQYSGNQSSNLQDMRLQDSRLSSGRQNQSSQAGQLSSQSPRPDSIQSHAQRSGGQLDTTRQDSRDAGSSLRNDQTAGQ